MKILKLIFIFLFYFSSHAQIVNEKKNNVPMNSITVTDGFEKFDFAKFDSIKGHNSMMMKNGDYIEYLKEGDELMIRNTPADSYFTLIKIFYLNGNIKEK